MYLIPTDMNVYSKCTRGTKWVH